MCRVLLRLVASGLAAVLAAGTLDTGVWAQTPKRIYLANDDHTDYMWTADEAAYRQAFLEMIDFYLDQADRTAANPLPYQGRFSLDGSFWIWEYEHNRPAVDLTRLMNRLKDGHLSVTLNPLVTLPGAMPTEAVLRSMYYAGQLERRFSLRIPIAASIENQTLPYGLSGLWAGSGARYSWKGVCGCATKVPTADLRNRDQEIYWLTAPDGSRILMKWNSLVNNDAMGGYAEARNPSAAVDYIDTDPTFASRYPFRVGAAFGRGWDDLKTFTDGFIATAQSKTNASRQVYVSNQLDFFQDFESNYGTQIPSVGASYGNEWDLLVASMSEVSATVKRSLARLRAAEALSTLIALEDPTFLTDREGSRDKAMINFGLYFEHDWTADGPVSRTARRDWQRRIAGEISSYVDTLYADATSRLGGQIQTSGTNRRFYVFNPLGWSRTDIAEVVYSGAAPVHVIDVTTGQEVPSQVVSFEGQQRLQIFASDVPAAGYKVFEIANGAGQAWAHAATVSGGNVLENAFYRIVFSGRGAVTSWVDKARGNLELVQPNNGFYVNDLGSATGSIQIEGLGPVSVTLTAVSSSPVAHQTRLTLVRNSRRVAIENRITQNFGSTQSWRFSFNVQAPDIHHEEVGAIIRARLTPQGGHYATRNARYDWLTLNHFADVTGSDGVGVTLSNADLYFMQVGNSTPWSLDTATPLVKVLAGGQVDGANLGIQGQGGDTDFLQRFALQSHDGYDAVAAMKFALEHQHPFVTGEITGGTSYPATSYSLLTVSDPGTLLWALKPADDGIDRGIVVRLWNIRDQPSTASVRLVSSNVESAARLSHIETFEESATVQDGALVAPMAANQLRTYLLKSSAGRAPMPPGNLRIIR